MKNTFKIIFILNFAVINLNAQQIRPLQYLYSENFQITTDFSVLRYYKDVNNYFTPFIGTWKSQNGNQVFILTLWKVTQEPYPNSDFPNYYIDGIRGHYKLIENYGLPNETVIYTSEVNYPNTNTIRNYSLFADVTISNKMSGIIYDVNIFNPTQYQGLKGFIIMDISNDMLSASWNVSLAEEILSINQVENFVIPTSLTLIKQ